MVVTQALKMKDVGLAAYGLLIRDACTLARNFLEVSYSHTKREGNKVAHCLAKLVANLAMCNLDGRSSSYHLSSCSGWFGPSSSIKFDVFFLKKKKKKKKKFMHETMRVLKWQPMGRLRWLKFTFSTASIKRNWMLLMNVLTSEVLVLTLIV